ncbi:MAG TPA: histidine phosphatase family protein [Jatrophihabitans sp.]|uniref:histidine phosphatase family protein n=1 Tax=Jatrophihabitans sp. TaxID=1932789 RepID=UPI002E06F36E|nr:histidine phosphatase family protein [Jatrophihabitans sp.]
MTTTVHLLRHGEVHNPDRVLYGRLPGFRLSDLGVRQAQAAADWLRTRDIAYLVSSPLERAQQTARPLADALDLEIGTDERLIEADNRLQGRAVAGGKGLFTDPSNWKYFTNPIRPSWGEPYTEVAERVLAAARAARERAEGREAVCVSHQLPIVAARRSAEGKRLFHDPRKRQCNLASVTSLTFDGEVIVRVDYAEPAAALPAGHGAGA